MIKNGTIFTGDNLPVMRGIDGESVDLIYLDPPFNSNRNYAAPVGSEAAGAAFKDIWTLEDTDDAWWGELADAHPALYRVIDAAGAAGGKGDKAYCIYMAVRLLEMHRILKSTGSLYLHCDPTMSHALKLLLDSVFGEGNFRNEIIWKRATPSGGKAGGQKFVPLHDVIFCYAKGNKFTHNRQYIPYTKSYLDQRFKHVDKSGRRYRLQLNNRKQYLDTSKGKPVSDIWDDIPSINPMAKEKTGYPTQKPLALLRRIIAASSNEGDMVLDPFCGCATACLASHDLHRKWIGIDISPKSFDLIKSRIRKELDLFGEYVIQRTDIPVRKDSIHRSKDIKHTLFGRQEGLCVGCGEGFNFRNFEVDHIVPKSKGGADVDSNLQLLCGWCNRKKGGKDMKYLIAELVREGIRTPASKRK